VENLPFASRCNSADRLRTVEMYRDVDVALGWRAVVLSYVDGVKELILTAHRASCGPVELQLLQQAFLGRTLDPRACDGFERPSPSVDDVRATAADLIREADLQMGLDWAADLSQGSEWTQTYVLSSGQVSKFDAECLVAAVGMVASAFCQSQTPIISALQLTGTPEDASLREGILLVPVDLRKSSTATLLASIRDGLRAQLWYTEELESELGAPLEVPIVVSLTSPFSIARGVTLEEHVVFTSNPSPLAISVTPQTSESLRLRCDVRDKGLSVSAIQSFLDSIATVYRQLCDQTNVSLSSIRLSNEELDVPRGAGESSGREQSRIDVLVAEKAAAQPDATAVVFEGERVRYADLSQRADRIARVLLDLGVRPGGRVALLLDRSCNLVIAMLAIMRMGASYVPLDSRWPVERVRYILDDAGVDLVVCDDDQASCATVTPSVPISELVRRAEALERVGQLPTSMSPRQEAYVIYTSGSTGRPKGVSIPHENVASLASGTARIFGFSPLDVWTMFHSPAFDFSVWEIWVCLVTGGTLVIVPFLVTRSPPEFVRLLADEDVTILSQTPSAFDQLIGVLDQRSIGETLRLVVLGGEFLNARKLLPWFDKVSEARCRTINMYGITETTVHVTWQQVTRWHAITSSKSVGVAIPGWHVAVMDEMGRLLPAGATGEIVVGGAGVASHYVNQSELTERRFVTRPGSKLRLYKTGDKGRRDADGRLTYLGRIDNQVKLRGFRIELDEIRTVVADAPGVSSAAVILAEGTPEDPEHRCIVAFVVLTATGDVGEVKRHIGRILPEYMMPAWIVARETLPITANGKANLSALSEAFASLRRTPPAQPDGAQQPHAVLKSILSDVLGREVKDDDNFFDVGGNSLAAWRVVSTLQKTGIDFISVRDLYVHQTIAALRSALESRPSQGSSD
jgi:amino acid adenylation domain-containing protein